MELKVGQIVKIKDEEWGEYAQYCNDNNLYPEHIDGFTYRICENQPDIKAEKENRIKVLKQELASTDYQAIKYAEGEMSAEEFAPIKEQRKAWRAEINRLEAELALYV